MANHILTIDDLIADLAAGAKPTSQHRIGIEHEKFLFNAQWQRLPYANGIDQIFSQLQQRYNWQPISENDTVIALERLNSQGTTTYISLEPGGQFELSGAPYSDLHTAVAEIHHHLQELQDVVPGGTHISIGGFDPHTSLETMPWMPKQRYVLMRRYMPTRGDLGLSMMTRSCTVQVNLDFTDETDMIRKWRVALALQPIVSALFANSPYTYQGQVYQDFRQHIWHDTDPDRCGLLPFVFEANMGFHKYVDYILNMPMYFVRREGRYIDALGQSFRAFMQGKLPALPNEYPTLEDWHDHLSTAFPEVRLKHYLELRSADACPPPLMFALPAVWVGLLYDETSLTDAERIIQTWPISEIQSLYQKLPRTALEIVHQGKSGWEWARQILDIATNGLKRRNLSEETYLTPLIDIINTQQTLASRFAHHTAIDFLRENCL